MLITDKAQLKRFSSPYRIWQGIPGIEVTKKGRIFSAFYSGETKEQINNYVVLLKSDDGTDFGEPIAVAFKENYRCYDECIWIDPIGRLWFTWAVAPEHAVYAVICDDPDADELEWGKVRKIGKDVMMNKPTVLSTGEWLFPMAVWRKGLCPGGVDYSKEDNDRKAFAYKTVDCGRTFIKLGGIEIKDRLYDEHSVVELLDGRLLMFVRTTYGIGVGCSFDRGITWTECESLKLKGPSSRAFATKLKSGRILLIYHSNTNERNNLTAMLSDDGCVTWKYKLLLDERANVSYPDAKESDDGYIYITYDRERGGFLKSLDEVYSNAREILYARITEDDIINGRLVDEGSKFGCIVSKLGKYALESENPFGEINRFTDREFAAYASDKSDVEILNTVFEHFSVNCMSMDKLDTVKLDDLIDKLSFTSERENAICGIISLLRSVDGCNSFDVPIVDRIKETVQNNLSDDVSVKDIADLAGVSMYYMCHIFKKTTGLTVGDYKKGLKLTKAKKLLVNTDMKISDIAFECGFSSDSYFSKVFVESEGISPSKYRRFAKYK